jgi:hypothetical protein
LNKYCQIQKITLPLLDHFTSLCVFFYLSVYLVSFSFDRFVSCYFYGSGLFKNLLWPIQITNIIQSILRKRQKFYSILQWSDSLYLTLSFYSSSTPTNLSKTETFRNRWTADSLQTLINISIFCRRSKFINGFFYRKVWFFFLSKIYKNCIDEDELSFNTYCMFYIQMLLKLKSFIKSYLCCENVRFVNAIN